MHADTTAMNELWTALGVMQQAGLEFEVVSTDTFIQDEVTGQGNTITTTLDALDEEEVLKYDGLMIVSGNMKDTELYWTHPKVQAFVLYAHTADMPMAAICCSVPTIRLAANGKRVSFYPLVRSRALLQQAGAILSTVAISVDGKLVTAEHQMASQVWAEHFVKVMNGEETDPGLTDSGYTPMGKTPKRFAPEVELAREKFRKMKEGGDTDG